MCPTEQLQLAFAPFLPVLSGCSIWEQQAGTDMQDIYAARQHAKTPATCRGFSLVLHTTRDCPAVFRPDCALDPVHIPTFLGSRTQICLKMQSFCLPSQGNCCCLAQRQIRNAPVAAPVRLPWLQFRLAPLGLALGTLVVPTYLTCVC